MDLSVVSEHNFVFCGDWGQRPNKHETGGFRVNGIRLFSQSGYRFALLAGFYLPFVAPTEITVHHFSLSALMHRSMYRCDSSSPFPAK